MKTVYYRDFGAAGDGKTDDFHAIKAAHDYANENKLPVCAEAGACYYIGAAALEKREFITVKTDTDWTGAEMLFDDAVIPVEYVHEKHIYKGREVLCTDADVPEDAVCERCLKKIHVDRGGCTQRTGADAWHKLSIFKILSDYPKENIPELAGASVKRGDKYIRLANGEIYKPGRRTLIHIIDESRRHYIRYGTNENNGSPQQEILVVRADGEIDGSTPVEWDYASISSAEGKCTEDTPITLKGCKVTTAANRGPDYYYSYGRNIVVERSNVTVIGIKHRIIGEGLRDESGRAYGKCPTGFTKTSFAENVEWRDMLYQHQKNHYDASSGALLGTYEISGDRVNNIRWINCDTARFFNEDGSVSYKGFFGSNFCKNYLVENSTLLSFDAHCGAYNVTLKNSTFEHINCIGGGSAHLENIVVYADGAGCLINLRDDYGSTWNGDVFVKNAELRTADKESLTVFRGAWFNHYFGYTCRLPENVTLDNVSVSRISYRLEGEGDGSTNRIEEISDVNKIPLHYFGWIERFPDFDISDPRAVCSTENDLKRCNCESFCDTDGDGRCNNTVISKINKGNRIWCWGTKEEPDRTRNINPYAPTKKITVKNCRDLELIIPKTPQFEKHTLLTKE